MFCPFCNTVNDDQNSFCVSCGKTIPNNLKTSSDGVPPTQVFQTNEPESVKTTYPPKQVSYQSTPQSFGQEVPFQQSPAKSSKTGLIVALSILLILILGISGAGLYFLLEKEKVSIVEALPDHLGMFIQNADKTKLDEIKLQDVANSFEEKERLLTNESLPKSSGTSEFVLYSDAKEIAITDLKLVQLDSIKDDGNMSQIDFQAVPVDGKPAMKKLRLPNGIAKGKYAFVLFNGNLDEGNHKFWAFQVADSNKSNNDDIARPATVPVKNPGKSNEKAKDETETAKKQEPAPKKDTKVEPPSGSNVAYCNGNDVLLRGSPSLTGKKIGKLSKGQRIYIIYYSENYDVWRGTNANWAFIQTESGARGWVFTPFVYF